MAVVTLVYGHYRTGNANNTMRLCLMNLALPTGFEASNIISAIDMLCSDHVSLNHMTASTGTNSPWYDLANSFEGIGTSISKIKPIFAPRQRQ
ncbi:hypothetical protein CY34DRAFT_813487 [Suillus luteus UH-Slu-Lm8-n1]|uniref:Uncharacterized protein n=1 Tax=Suillus luteus UH-Slu-Lm8-n1 TaxID=930992 RepID=A0A0C9ZW47_9AGAM|nr:hypothetical protein CY34DRAFT_813487 [Suillus luteus UH-Slu-Lm8-n1]